METLPPLICCWPFKKAATRIRKSPVAEKIPRLEILDHSHMIRSDSPTSGFLYEYSCESIDPVESLAFVGPFGSPITGSDGRRTIDANRYILALADLHLVITGLRSFQCVTNYKLLVLGIIRWGDEMDGVPGLLVEMRARKNDRPVCCGYGKRRPGYDRFPTRTWSFVPLWQNAVWRGSDRNR